MPYIDRNISKSMFYSALVVKFVRTACSSLLYKELNQEAMELFNRIKAQVARSRKALSKIIRRHEKAFAKFGKNCDEILSELHI